MDILEQLEGYNNSTINRSINRLYSSNDLDVRMDCVDTILFELQIIGVDISDIEDNIKDLAIN